MIKAEKSSKVDLTRKRIVSAAEKTFAQKGFRAMTLRDVTREAKVNLAAVNYHFGSKTNLMRAVIQKCIVPINEERIRRLDALIAQHGAIPIPTIDIFTALIQPLFEQATQKQPKNYLMAIIGRALTEPADFMHALHKEFFAELSKSFITQLKRSCPQLTDEELYFRFFFSVSTMLGSIVEQTRLETFSNGKLDAKNLNVIDDRLIRYVVAGFEQKAAKD